MSEMAVIKLGVAGSALYYVLRYWWQGLIEPVLAAVAMKLFDVLDLFGIHL